MIINSYDIKNQIEAMFAKPATTFVRYDQFKILLMMIIMKKINLKKCVLINNEEEYDNLYFLTALKDSEISSMKIKSNFLGFQLITHQGLLNISPDKFHRDSINYEKQLNSPLIESSFDNELKDTAEKLLKFLRVYCQKSLESPKQSDYNNYYYTLIIQRRKVNDAGLQKFQQLLNLGVRIHRFNPINNSTIENYDSL